MPSTFSQLLLVLHYGGPQTELAHHITRYLRETHHYEGAIKVMQPSHGRWTAQDLGHIDHNMDLDGPLYLHSLLDSVEHNSSIGPGTLLSIWLFEDTSGDARQETLSKILALVNQGIAVQFAYNRDIAGLQQMMMGFRGQLESVNDSGIPVKFREATINSQGVKSLSDDLYNLLRRVEIPPQDGSQPQEDEETEEAYVTSFEADAEDEPPSPPAPPPPPSPPPLPAATATWDVKEPDDPYHPVPHEYLAAISGMGLWKIVGSSVRGRGHAHDAKYREDSFAIDTIDCWNIIAVSDGAGSRKYSRIGSKYATAAAARGMKDFAKKHDIKNVSADEMPSFIEEALYVGMQHAYQRLETYIAEEREIEINFHDLGCTLLLSIYCEVGGRRFVGGFQIGDGLIMVAYDPQNMGDFDELTEPDSADFGGGTTFITSEPLEEWLNREAIVHELDRAPWLLMAMTDGVSDDMVPYDRNVPRFLLPGIERAGVLTIEDSLDEAAQKLLMMISYEKKGSFDDRTLVVMFQYLPEGTAITLDTSVAKTVPSEHHDHPPSDAPPSSTH